jgi:glyoxylase-like metal-dependent hydrolase (beta-lactamase superfamily II)
LKQETGAQILGCAPHQPARDLAYGEINRLDAANDIDYRPDLVMRDGDTITGKNFSLAAVETPGHTMNHVTFALLEENALFSGDHVMGWSTSIVAPPDGAMSPYMASLDKLRGRDDKIYWPGHGGPVVEPQRFVRALANHRRQREKSILARLAAGDSSIEIIVAKIYEGLNPALRGAAALSVFAHIEDLVARGLVGVDGPPTLSAAYRTI